MINKRITLLVNAEVYDKCKKYCDKKKSIYLYLKQIKNSMRNKPKKREKNGEQKHT